jgi:hypothetical protein
LAAREAERVGSARFEEDIMTTVNTEMVTDDAVAGRPMTTTADDVHTRIRDAAIDQFGRHGFDVGLQAVADAAESTRY